MQPEDGRGVMCNSSGKSACVPGADRHPGQATRADDEDRPLAGRQSSVVDAMELAYWATAISDTLRYAVGLRRRR